MALIAQLPTYTEGIRALGKVEKVYLDNTNLIYILSKERADIGNIRETFFFNQAKVKYSVYSSPIADFTINKFTFETGGKNKSQQQIKEAKNAFLVKDDIEKGFLNVIPLWQMGIMY